MRLVSRWRGTLGWATFVNEGCARAYSTTPGERWTSECQRYPKRSRRTFGAKFIPVACSIICAKPNIIRTPFGTLLRVVSRLRRKVPLRHTSSAYPFYSSLSRRAIYCHNDVVYSTICFDYHQHHAFDSLNWRHHFPQRIVAGAGTW